MSEKSVIIVMELCDGGELQSYLERKTRLTEAEAIGFIKQIINGFKGLH
jgi:serine/threonine protein kinase